MKKIILSVLISFVSLQAFAEHDCKSAALEVAKANMDLKAKAYGFSSSDVANDTISIEPSTSKDKSITYSVEAHIYKGTYIVNVVMDSICGVQGVLIEEVLSLE